MSLLVISCGGYHDKSVIHRKTDCAREINSGERMFAGGEDIVRGRTPAKPRWSEVIVFW